MSFTIPANARAAAKHRIAPAAIEEDSMANEAEMLLPAGETAKAHWLDLGFRLIILALTAAWLVASAIGGGPVATNGTTIATTR